MFIKLSQPGPLLVNSSRVCSVFRQGAGQFREKSMGEEGWVWGWRLGRLVKGLGSFCGCGVYDIFLWGNGLGFYFLTNLFFFCCPVSAVSSREGNLRFHGLFFFFPLRLSPILCFFWNLIFILKERVASEVAAAFLDLFWESRSLENCL